MYVLTERQANLVVCSRLIPHGVANIHVVVVGSTEIRMAALLQHPGYEEERLQRVAEQLPCREVQTGMLLSLMGQVCACRLLSGTA